MPGNGVGDRVHNFFAQDNLSQGPRGDGNWPLNDNLWVGNQKQFGVSDSSPRNFNPQQSETERGHGSQRVDPHLFNLTQTRPEFTKNLSHREQSNSNGFMYGRQNFQTTPNEANFMGVDAEYGRNNMNQRGFPFYESQQEPVPQEPPKNPFRSETSEPHSGFDLFGNQSQSQSQNQMNNNQYPGFMQPLQQQQQQQPGFGDIQQLQQQLMLRKMQELQRQELQRQEELQRQQQQQQQQNSLNQASLFARQASGSHINGTPNSEWAEVAVNTNWLQRATPQVQGSSGGLAFSPEQSQPQRSMGFVNQQVDQSLYGVPVSRNQFPHQQPQNPFPGNHYGIPDPGKSLFGNTSGQGQIQQIKAPQNVAQDLFGPVVEDKSGNSEAALDPDEEKILFGSDDTNIWEAFGSSKNTGGGVSSLLEDNEFASGLPSSLQSGSWSALMQSAVAETISSGAGAQEEWPDLNFQNPEVPLVVKQDDINLVNSGSVPVSDSGIMNQSKQMNQGFKGMPGHWTSQQQNNKQNWNANESVVPPGNPRFNMNEDDSSLQQSDWKRVMNNGMGQGEGISGINPLVRGAVNRGNNFNQFPANNNQVNYWKNVDSKSRGSENSERSQGRMNKGPQVSESSFNSSDKEDLKMHEMENSNDSYRSGSSHLPNTFGQRETFSDAGDSRSLGGTKQQSLPNQGNRKAAAGSRKFQYHPMGNLDEDVGMPYGRTQGANTKSVPLQHSQGHFGHTKIGGQSVKSSETGKEVEGVPRGSHDMRFKGMIPGHVPDLFAPHDRSVGLSTPDKASQPSQNMLELLHKVDQSRDRGITRQMNNSLERNLSSEIPEPENSDGSFGGHQRSQSSNSQGIGLQLGPPSQRLPLPNHASQRTMQTVKPNSMNQTQVSNSRGKGQSNLSPFQSSHDGEFKNDRMSISGQTSSETSGGHKMVTNFSAALGTDLRNQFQNQQTVNARGQVLPTNHSGNESGHTSQIRQADETRVRSLNSGLYDNLSERVQASQPSTGEKFPAAQPRGNSGVSPQVPFPKMLPNTWANIPTQQLFSRKAQAQAQTQSNLATLHPLNIVESTTSLGQQNVEEQKQSTKESPSVDRSQIADGPGVNDPSSLNASQRDLEAFGRSLKPTNNISLPNQMKAMKNTENDPNKRLKDQENLLGGQQVAPWSGQPREHTTIPPQDTEMSGNVVVAKEVVAIASDQNGSQSIIPSVKIEHSQSHITPQMAPSWFDQSGTVKSGQMMPAVKTLEQQPFGRVSGSLEAHDKELGSVAADPSQAIVISKPVVPSPVAVEQLSSPPLQNPVPLKSKKRKYSTRDLHPWLKEVTGTVKNVQDICNASMEWCGATNRLMEKVEDDGEVIEDVPRPKRRIIITTQLMQQLFPAPPATILSTDATLNYESVAFNAARLALGDACNLVSSGRSSSSDSHGGSDPISDKNKESEKTNDNRLEEVVEDCMSKSKRLESDFSRLDKRASMLDLRVECQDLEKFSIINRFAKFHGRGQADGEGSSSDAAANVPKPFPQRYVIAVPLPKNLPERVQCLSL